MFFDFLWTDRRQNYLLLLLFLVRSQLKLEWRPWRMVNVWPAALFWFSTLFWKEEILRDVSWSNISSVVEFQRWWVIKSKLFGQESTYSKVFFFRYVDSSKSAKIVFSKSNFDVKNQLNFFKKNLGLGQIFCPKD